MLEIKGSIEGVVVMHCTSLPRAEPSLAFVSHGFSGDVFQAEVDSRSRVFCDASPERLFAKRQRERHNRCWSRQPLGRVSGTM